MKVLHALIPVKALLSLERKKGGIQTIKSRQ